MAQVHIWTGSLCTKVDTPTHMSQLSTTCKHKSGSALRSLPLEDGARKEPAHVLFADLSPFRREIQESEEPRAWSRQGRGCELQAGMSPWFYRLFAPGDGGTSGSVGALITTRAVLAGVARPMHQKVASSILIQSGHMTGLQA